MDSSVTKPGSVVDTLHVTEDQVDHLDVVFLDEVEDVVRFFGHPVSYGSAI